MKGARGKRDRWLAWGVPVLFPMPYVDMDRGAFGVEGFAVQFFVASLPFFFLKDYDFASIVFLFSFFFFRQRLPV